MNARTAAATGLLTAVLLATSALDAQTGDPSPAPEPDVVVEVEGLSCPFCAYGIEKKFVEREEVDSVFVALEENEVRLWLKPDFELTDAEVKETVEKAGFTPGPIRRPPDGGGGGGEDHGQDGGAAGT